ncbi:type I restriction enzyme S subunit [Geothermobacter ehrlichii]|uniref:Type I restriction enzyme S subunit n=1 Tax=Geothermobacter ehrlichii TaxID=213224 RepID=A0A5D3WKG1_9BACT|nr:type I restriction enzyme S subunit [Geothermobacter ehrlichii]
MRRYKPYPKYKDSGVEWLGEVPEHWDIKPLLAVSVERKVKNTGNIENNVLSLSYGKIIRRSVDTDFGLLPASFETYQIIEPGDIILRLTDLQNDQRSLRTGCAKERGIITSAYLCLRPSNSVDSRYLHYLLHAYDIQKIFYSMGGGVRQSMGFGDLRRLPVTIPVSDEQQAIAAFLDRETARIDALIEKKQRLIELLKEKRQAIITQAVTKGLDPNVPMKDSGVEWLGEVPAHWEVLPLKRLVSKIVSGTSVNAIDKPAENGELAVLKTSSVYSGNFEANENKTVVEEDLHRVSCPVVKNTLIVSRMNTPSLVGAAGYVSDDYPNIYLPDRLWMVFFDISVVPQFVHYWTMTSIYRTQVEMVCAGTSSSMQNISQGDFLGFYLAIPPKAEQGKIVERLTKQCTQICKLITTLEFSVNLLKERRAALITAAVTGQIDVRGE